MLQNNNQSMATVVETFIIEETSELLHDNDALDQWNAKVTELGLSGQEKVRVVGKSPIPFMWMNSALIKTFEVLCPKKENIQAYSNTPIPVEILNLVSMSVKEGYFDKIEIWHNEKNPDPVCIGYKYTVDGSEWNKDWYAKKYLIGRWADVKSSLDTLVKNAKAIFIYEQRTEISLTIKRNQRELEDLEQAAEQAFGTALPTTDFHF